MESRLTGNKLEVEGNSFRTRRSRNSEQGQALVEYTLGLVLVGLVAMVSLLTLAPTLNEAYCKAILTIDPYGTHDLCAGSGSEVTILKAKYDVPKGELDLVAKAPEGCDEDLIVQEYGETMDRAGSSFVFKKTIPGIPPPPHVTIGTDNCGWTTAPVE